jgi:hypothetical protein
MLGALRGPVGRAAAGPLVLAVTLVALLTIPTVAAAAPTVSIEIGPLKAAHGYRFNVYVSDCAGTSGAELDYARGTTDNGVDYSYTGSGTCLADTSLKHGGLAISWPGFASISLKTVKSGRSRKAVTPAGCHGAKGISRQVKMKGIIDITADSHVFGTTRSRRVTAFISRISNLKCGSYKTPKSTDFDAFFGQNLFLDAEQPAKGARTVFINDTFVPIAGVSGNVAYNLTGASRGKDKKKLFNVTKRGSRAVVSAAKPYTRGKLEVAALRACIGGAPGIVNATISGGLTIDDPVVGKLVLAPATASNATIGTGDGDPLECDGYGSAPLTNPAVDNYCSDASEPCSISEGFSADTFYNDANMNQGTQTIVAETINFGDGTAGTLANGSVTHTYTTPGSYTATISIETNNGQTFTTTTPVYITS